MANILRKEHLVSSDGKPYIKTYFDDGTYFDPYETTRCISQEAYAVIDKLDSTIFYIEDYMQSREIFMDLIEELRTDLRKGFEFEEYRYYPVQFKFYHNDKEDVKVLAFNIFVFNLTIWYPLVCITEEYPDASRFIELMQMTQKNCTRLNAATIRKYMNTWYVKPYQRFVDVRHMNRIIGKTQYLLTRIPTIFSRFLGITCNIDMFLEQEDLNPEYKKLTRFKLDTTMQPAEMERAQKEAANQHLQLLLNTVWYNQFKSIVQDIKMPQLTEFQTVIGMKANTDSKVNPTPINENWLIGDIGSIQKFYTNCITGRKASIINNEYMGTTGHFLIMVAILSNSVKLSNTTVDCDTVNPISINVRSEKHLQKINGRRYRIGNDKTYHTVDSDRDKDLIGKNIWMRSPITCACKDGICRECYGDLYYVNRTLNSAGELGALIVMNPATQSILSAKHFQGTKSEIIDFGPDFDKFFTISSTNITMNTNIEDISDYQLAIKVEDFQTTDTDEDELERLFAAKRKSRRSYKKKDTSDDDDDAIDTECKYYTNRFYVIKPSPKKGQPPLEVYEFQDKDSKSLLMHDDFVSRLIISASDNEGEYLSIPLDDLDANEYAFIVNVENEELTKAVKSITNLINNSKHEGCDTIDQMVQKMIDLLVEANINAVAVHGEMIIVKLIRDANNILERPNFRLPLLREDYQVLTVNKALKKDPSVDTSLSTPYLKYQLTQDPDTFKKTATSDYDPAFRLYMEEDDRRPVERYMDHDVFREPNTWDFLNDYDTVIQVDRDYSNPV